jgi:hypothetical protein
MNGDPLYDAFAPYGMDPSLIPAPVPPFDPAAMTHGALTPPGLNPLDSMAGIANPGNVAPGIPAPSAPSPLDAGPDINAAIGVGPDTKVTKTLVSPEMQADLEGLSANDAARIGTAGQQTALDTKLAKENERLAIQEEKNRQDMERQAAAEKAKIEGEKQAAFAYQKKLRDDYAHDYERDFLKEKGVAGKWIAALSVGLGGFSAGILGGENQALKSIMFQMEQHAAREKGRLARKRDEMLAAGEDVKAIDQRLRDFDTVTRPQMESSLLKAAEARRKTMLSSFGADQAKINGDKMVQELNAASLERDFKTREGLAAKIETDNAEQNKLRRQQALGQTGPKLTEAQDKVLGTVATAMTNLKEAGALPEFNSKDQGLIRKFTSVARNIQPGKAEEVLAQLNQISGSYINQLSEPGRQRFNRIYTAVQDLERNLSGGSIQPHELSSLLESAASKGGVQSVVQRAKDLSVMAGAGKKEAYRLIDDAFAGKSSTAEAPNPKASAEVRAEAASLLRTVTDPRAKAALEYVRDNPGDPRASEAILRARKLSGN